MIGNAKNPLKQQLSTLTTAMATLTEEKSKMEANFQQDKRAMLVGVCVCACLHVYVCVCTCACVCVTNILHTQAQHDSLTKQLQTERESAKKESKELQQQIEEVPHAHHSLHMPSAVVCMLWCCVSIPHRPERHCAVSSDQGRRSRRPMLR